MHFPRRTLGPACHLRVWVLYPFREQTEPSGLESKEGK